MTDLTTTPTLWRPLRIGIFWYCVRNTPNPRHPDMPLRERLRCNFIERAECAARCARENAIANPPGAFAWGDKR